MKTVTPLHDDRPYVHEVRRGEQRRFQFHLHGLIQSHGWTVIPVVADRVDRPWAYTIGLAGSLEHPELVVVGLVPEAMGRLLNSIGDMVRDGVKLRAGERIAGAGNKRMRLERFTIITSSREPSPRGSITTGRSARRFPSPGRWRSSLPAAAPRLHGRDW